MSTWILRRHPLPALGAWRHWRPGLSTEALVACASLFFTVACNGLFWRSALAVHPGSLRLAASLFLLLAGVHALLLGLLAWRWNVRVLLTMLLPLSLAAAHYMGRYHLYLDADMLRNVLATDHKESGELVTPSLLWPLAAAIVPVLATWRVRLVRHGAARALLRRGAFLLGALAMAGGGALLASQDVSSLLRGHREVRYLATPANILVGLPRALRGDNPVRHAPKLAIGQDARKLPRAPGSRPRLLVIVVGETVRAANWGLNGYVRQTTPELERIGVVNFPDMHACGTATEVSLPCMFSPWGRHDYDEARIRSHQSLLHVLEHAGIATLWRDNQSGCKGVCEGLAVDRLGDATDPALCANGRCLDEILLERLPERVRARPGDQVVVLHPLGNHGPSYFERYPASFRRYTPTCDTPDLGGCSRQQVVNSYDNAVLYADHVLARTIDTLGRMDDYDTAMVYLSDHGESLGEKGLYLHGVPWAIAPEQQTRVPMAMWFSAGFAADRGLDLACLRERAARPADQDLLFSSVLGLMQVRTALYDPRRDLFAGCAPSGRRPDRSAGASRLAALGASH
ncbi:phosphoethanolamine transferase [Pseudoxanthomonas sp. 10H]|uniref:phosphoethanolamine transferase n=1 Tax=Pseudoxanthomonas sp. 10H TaxID=3242729 RepID=UPI003558CC62